MQTMTQDSNIASFMNYIDSHKENITLSKDNNLKLDPYFYDRQNELQQIRNDIKSGTSQLISFEEFEKNTKEFEKKLELKYAN